MNFLSFCLPEKVALSFISERCFVWSRFFGWQFFLLILGIYSYSLLACKFSAKAVQQQSQRSSLKVTIFYFLGALKILFFALNFGSFRVMCLQSVQFSSGAQSCLTLCDPMDCSMPGLSVHHQLLKLDQSYVHQVHDVIQPSHPLSSPSPPALNLSQHQGLFK